MKRSFVALAALAAATAVAGDRHFLLEEGGGPPGRVRFLSQAITLADGAKQSWVTITRTGDFNDPRYGDFKITPTHLEQMVSNFDRRVFGQDVFLDVSHRPSDGAAGKFLKLQVQGDKLRGLVEWTDFGLEAVKKRGFVYLSAEFHENFKDNEKQAAHGCVLLGAGLTIRPVIKHLDPVQLSHDNDHDDEFRLAISPQLFKELTEPSMNYLDQLKTKLLALGLSDDTVTKLLAQAKAQFDAVSTDQVKSLALIETWAATGQAVVSQLKAAGTDPKTVTITLAAPAPAAPSQADIDASVTRMLAERDKEAATNRATMEAKVKLLSDTIAAGDTTLTPEGVKKLAEEVLPLISVAATDDQVKHLAGLQVAKAKELSAAVKLATLGYKGAAGSVQITVDSSNQINGLQDVLDKRLGYVKVEGDTTRFFATGGRLLAENKAYAEKALAQFDQVKGAQLYQEAKLLAAGVGNIGDIKVPASVERTVLREQLFNLTSLNFMDLGTVTPAPTYMIPYSWRDTTAAGTGNLRRYEGQGIMKAGIKQDWDTAYNTPQKLAFQVTKEMQMLLSGAPIDFDPIAENVRNIVRIIGEDTEALNINEIVRSADEAYMGNLNDVLTAQVNGANSVFVCSQFPIVRPRTQYDLQGNVALATVNALTVTLNGVARSEYVRPTDGSALGAGLYYVMDYNLGELRFVNENGVLQVPTNGWVLSVVGKYSTNVAKIDLDLGALTVGQKYDNVLTAIGSRKVVIEDDRFYNASMCLMTGGVNNALGQATTFTANGARVGTSLNADGSVGVTKGIQTYKVSAPGMLINDNRIVVGEMRNSRFRMAQAFSMGQLQEARNGNNQFIAALEGYGQQFVVSHTPVNRKNAATSLILYSATARVARVG